MSNEQANVNRGLHPVTGEPIDAITATDLRRHFGNAIVVPPVRGHFERNEDGSLGRFVVVEEAVIVNNRVVWPSERAALLSELRDCVVVAEAESIIDKALAPYTTFPADDQAHTSPHGDPLR